MERNEQLEQTKEAIAKEFESIFFSFIIFSLDSMNDGFSALCIGIEAQLCLESCTHVVLLELKWSLKGLLLPYQMSLTQEGLILFPGPVNGQHLSFRPSHTKTSWHQHASVLASKAESQPQVSRIIQII